MEKDYPDLDDGTTDILGILRLYETDPPQYELLCQKYTDIFLVFDFEPQDMHPNFKMIRRMMNYYVESTDQGKMFINYPMMQSYKHFDYLPNAAFKDLTVDLRTIHHYKELVGKVSRYSDLTKYDFPLFVAITVHHLKKVKYVLSNEYVLPDEQDYVNWSLISLYDRQVNRLISENEIFVVNTSVFILVDFMPHRFFKYVQVHQSSLKI